MSSDLRLDSMEGIALMKPLENCGKCNFSVHAQNIGILTEDIGSNLKYVNEM
jgi:hypothetical protein